MTELLRVILFLPLAAALLLHGNRQWMRVGTLIVTLVVLGLTADLVARYSHAAQDTGIVAETNDSWLKLGDSAIDIRFSIAIDGLSLWLFALTSLLTVVAVLVSWEAIEKSAPLYYRLLLLLGTGMLGVFVARDIILFYIFFEFTLIPLFFLIGLWGGQQRRHAAVKFFLFTLAGSLLTFLGLLAVVLWCYYNSDANPAMRTLTFSISQLTESLRNAAMAGHAMDLRLQIGIFLALFAGFAIKTPLFPLHTWLPLAHVEAPMAGSVLLAGLLLKVGTYGLRGSIYRCCPRPPPCSCPGSCGLRWPAFSTPSLWPWPKPTSSGWSPTRASAISASACWDSSPSIAWECRGACCKWSATAWPPVGCSP